MLLLLTSNTYWYSKESNKGAWFLRAGRPPVLCCRLRPKTPPYACEMPFGLCNGQCRRRIEAQLAHDRGTMRLDGLDADPKKPCHFLVGAAFGDQLYGLALRGVREVSSVPMPPFKYPEKIRSETFEEKYVRCLQSISRAGVTPDDVLPSPPS